MWGVEVQRGLQQQRVNTVCSGLQCLNGWSEGWLLFNMPTVSSRVIYATQVSAESWLIRWMSFSFWRLIRLLCVVSSFAQHIKSKTVSHTLTDTASINLECVCAPMCVFVCTFYPVHTLRFPPSGYCPCPATFQSHLELSHRKTQHYSVSHCG